MSLKKVSKYIKMIIYNQNKMTKFVKNGDFQDLVHSQRRQMTENGGFGNTQQKKQNAVKIVENSQNKYEQVQESQDRQEYFKMKQAQFRDSLADHQIKMFNSNPSTRRITPNKLELFPCDLQTNRFSDTGNPASFQKVKSPRFGGVKAAAVSGGPLYEVKSTCTSEQKSPVRAIPMSDPNESQIMRELQLKLSKNLYTQYDDHRVEVGAKKKTQRGKSRQKLGSPTLDFFKRLIWKSSIDQSKQIEDLTPLQQLIRAKNTLELQNGSNNCSKNQIFSGKILQSINGAFDQGINPRTSTLNSLSLRNSQKFTSRLMSSSVAQSSFVSRGSKSRSPVQNKIRFANEGDSHFKLSRISRIRAHPQKNFQNRNYENQRSPSSKADHDKIDFQIQLKSKYNTNEGNQRKDQPKDTLHNSSASIQLVPKAQGQRISRNKLIIHENKADSTSIASADSPKQNQLNLNTVNNSIVRFPKPSQKLKPPPPQSKNLPKMNHSQSSHKELPRQDLLTQDLLTSDLQTADLRTQDLPTAHPGVPSAPAPTLPPAPKSIGEVSCSSSGSSKSRNRECGLINESGNGGKCGMRSGVQVDQRAEEKVQERSYHVDGVNGLRASGDREAQLKGEGEL